MSTPRDSWNLPSTKRAPAACRLRPRGQVQSWDAANRRSVPRARTPGAPRSGADAGLGAHLSSPSAVAVGARDVAAVPAVRTTSWARWPLGHEGCPLESRSGRRSPTAETYFLVFADARQGSGASFRQLGSEVLPRAWRLRSLAGSSSLRRSSGTARPSRLRPSG
jgi:hypothetical protein